MELLAVFIVFIKVGNDAVKIFLVFRNVISYILLKYAWILAY